MSSDIVYTHIDELSPLPSNELKKYYDKIKPFKIWVPQWLSVGGNMSVEISPGKWKKFGSNYDEYKEFFETLNHDEKFYLVQKIPFDCISDSYLYNNLNGDTPVPIPAFRGLLGIVLNQVRIGTSPYLKPWSFLGKRTDT
ncbi:hypothetical protein LCGC14_2888370, partial [marine sediment metagenome]